MAYSILNKVLQSSQSLPVKIYSILQLDMVINRAYKSFNIFSLIKYSLSEISYCFPFDTHINDTFGHE